MPKWRTASPAKADNAPKEKAHGARAQVSRPALAQPLYNRANVVEKEQFMIPFSPPDITQAEIDEVVDTVLDIIRNVE